MGCNARQRADEARLKVVYRTRSCKPQKCRCNWQLWKCAMSHECQIAPSQAPSRLLLRAYSSAWPDHQRGRSPAVIGQRPLGPFGPAWLRSQRALKDLRALSQF